MSVWYLGAEINDVFNHAGAAFMPFHAFQDQTEFQNRSWSGGVLTTETNGWRLAVEIGHTNIIKDIHEEVGYNPVSSLISRNLTGWYPIDLSFGMRYSNWNYDATTNFTIGENYNWMMSDKAEIATPTGNVYQRPPAGRQHDVRRPRERGRQEGDGLRRHGLGVVQLFIDGVLRFRHVLCLLSHAFRLLLSTRRPADAWTKQTLITTAARSIRR